MSMTPGQIGRADDNWMSASNRCSAFAGDKRGPESVLTTSRCRPCTAAGCRLWRRRHRRADRLCAAGPRPRCLSATVPVPSCARSAESVGAPHHVARIWHVEVIAGLDRGRLGWWACLDLNQGPHPYQAVSPLIDSSPHCARGLRQELSLGRRRMTARTTRGVQRRSRSATEQSPCGGDAHAGNRANAGTWPSVASRRRTGGGSS